MSAPAREVFAQITQEHSADENRLKRLQAVHTERPTALDVVKREFLLAQGVGAAVVYGLSDAALNRRLARLLLQGLEQDYTRTRGILFDMQRHSAGLRRRMRDEPHPPAPAAQPS